MKILNMGKVVIIPAYNPDETLKELVLENWKKGNLVLAVDDGSDPSCSSIFREVEEKSIVLHHKRNLGKGAAIKTALTYIKEELRHCSAIISPVLGRNRSGQKRRVIRWNS